MEMQIERALPIVAGWGAWILAALLAATLLAMWRVGRGRRLLVPERWPSRLVQLGLFACATLLGGGLFVLLGPMRPMLEQVRSVGDAVGRPAGDLAFLEVADDSPRRLSELRGKVVLLNLWATWCPPCRKEMPAIDRLQRDYADRGLVVVTLSNEERDRLRAYAAEHPLGTLNVYASQLGWLDVRGRPLTMVIDREGVVRACMIGGRTYADFERAVKKYLVVPS
jgi:thiol-disulfide isomerase/thioredoxin